MNNILLCDKCTRDDINNALFKKKIILVKIFSLNTIGRDTISSKYNEYKYSYVILNIMNTIYV